MNGYVPDCSFVVNILDQNCQRWIKQLTGRHVREGRAENAKGYAVPCEHERVECNDFTSRILYPISSLFPGGMMSKSALMLEM
jgi:hypothetical protein